MDADELKTTALSLLQHLGSFPAISFWEDNVASYISTQLERLGLEPQPDKYGNLLAHLRGLDSTQPAIVLVAHMDHPGFEATAELGEDIIARAFGGVPQACFTQNARVILLDSNGQRLKGELQGKYGSRDDRVVSVRLDSPTKIEYPRPVILDLPDYRVDGDRVSMRAVDDLVGCASMLMVLEHAVKKHSPGDVYALFTRAEEVGLVGARLAAADGRFPKDCLVISLEASRTLPGAEIGGGVVIRVGDATYTFDAEAEQVLHKAKEELQAIDPEFKSQRQLMSGGTCEASAFAIHGYRTTGIAFPLENYHNSSSDGEITAEQISIGDFISGVKLLCQALDCVPRRDDSPAHRRLRSVPTEYSERLTRNSP